MHEGHDFVTQWYRMELFSQWARFWDTSKQFLVERSPRHVMTTRFHQALFKPDRTNFIAMLRHPLAGLHHNFELLTPKVLRDDCGALHVENWLVANEVLSYDLPELKSAVVLMYEHLMGEEANEIFGALQAAMGIIPRVVVSKTKEGKFDDVTRELYDYFLEEAEVPEHRRLLYERGPAAVKLIAKSDFMWVDSFLAYREQHLAQCNAMMWKYEARVKALGYSLFNPLMVTVPPRLKRWYIKGFDASIPTGNLSLINPVEEMESHNFLFIIGAHHSGTSLFKELFGMHPSASDHNNTPFPEDEGQYFQSVYNVCLLLQWCILSFSCSQDTTAFGAWYNFSFDQRAYMNEMHETVTLENKITLFEQWAQVRAVRGRFYRFTHQFIAVLGSVQIPSDRKITTTHNYDSVFAGDVWCRPLSLCCRHAAPPWHAAPRNEGQELHARAGAWLWRAHYRPMAPCP